MSDLTSEKLAARPSNRRIPELDGLRAVAIMLVIACHYPAFSSALHGLFEFGWVGVEIFFVLSGFLITSILLPLRTTRDPYIPFLERRAARIMPPYFLVLLMITIVYWTADLIPPGNSAEFVTTLPVFWRNVFFFFGMRCNLDYLAQTWRVITGNAHALRIFARTPLSPNFPGILTLDFSTAVGHFWSVSVEEWYYVLWAPVVLTLKRSGVAITGLFLIVFAFFVRWFGFSNWEWYVNFLCRCDMLAVGSLLALWMERRASLPHRAQRWGDRLLQAASLAALSCLGVLLLRLRPFLGKDIRGNVSFATFGPLLIAVITAGILAEVLNKSLSGHLLCRALRLSPLVYVGRRSYMIYLVHVPLYMLLWPACSVFSGGPLKQLWIPAVASAMLSLWIAALSWRFFESPILALRDRKSARNRIAAAPVRTNL